MNVNNSEEEEAVREEARASPLLVDWHLRSPQSPSPVPGTVPERDFQLASTTMRKTTTAATARLPQHYGSSDNTIGEGGAGGGGGGGGGEGGAGRGGGGFGSGGAAKSNNDNNSFGVGGVSGVACSCEPRCSGGTCCKATAYLPSPLPSSRARRDQQDSSSLSSQSSCDERSPLVSFSCVASVCLF